MKVKVLVLTKNEIEEPVGRALKQRLIEGGYSDVRGVRVGQAVELDFESGEENVIKDRASKIAKEILANSVSEEFEIVVADD